MARFRAPFLGPLLLILAGCGGADLVLTPGGATVTVSPQVVTVLPGGTTVFTAQVGGAKNQGVTWSVVGGASNGAFTGATNLYTAPVLPGTYTVVATSAADAGRAGTALAVVLQPVTVSVYPLTTTLAPGGSQLFTASVSGGGSQAVTWSVLGGSANGSFTGTSGLYTAPALSGTFTILATSVADPSRVDRATVTVNGPVTVSVSPNPVSLLPGGTQTFTATVNGITPTTVDWSALDGGIINIATGAYTAPLSPGAYSVKATSRANGTSYGIARVTVSQIGLSISPPFVTLDQGATQLFTPTITPGGTANNLVSWSVDGGTTLITQSGPYLYTAPTVAGTYALLAIPSADPSVLATASITVRSIEMDPVSPQASLVLPGGVVTFSTNVTGSTNKAVTWSVLENGAGGLINASGIYTAPASKVGSDTIVATAAADATVSRSAVVTVGSIVITPAAPDPVTHTTGTITFSATVTGVPDPAVNWSILPTENGGSITSVGYFTAPVQPGVYRVRATSKGNSALFKEVQVKVL